MKVLIIGGNGMLGHKLVQILSSKFSVWTTFRSDYSRYEKFDIFDGIGVFRNINAENFKSVEMALEMVKPDVVINAVGIIKQVASNKNVLQNVTVNSVFPLKLAELCDALAARLINIGTDCVFNGKKGNYQESDVADAEDVYGKSKNLGEATEGNCLTIRTSIIGRELYTSHSLIEWFLSNEGKKVKGYPNAIFSGFPTVVLAEILADLLENHPHLRGLYHVSSEPINKFDLLNLVKKAYSANIEIEADDSFRIDRSLDSTRFRAVTGFRPASWESMIERMAKDNALYQS